MFASCKPKGATTSRPWRKITNAQENLGGFRNDRLHSFPSQGLLVSRWDRARFLSGFLLSAGMLPSSPLLVSRGAFEGSAAVSSEASARRTAEYLEIWSTEAAMCTKPVFKATLLQGTSADSQEQRILSPHEIWKLQVVDRRFARQLFHPP